MVFNRDWESQIPVEKLRERLSYDPETGEIRRRVREKLIKGQRRSDDGKIATRLSENGYLRCVALNRQVMAHRVAWALHTGEWPSEYIDHIDGDRANNRIANLRLATYQQNNRNAAVRRDSVTGFAGVSFRRGKWHARIRHDGKLLHLGTFLTQSEAIAASVGARVVLHREFMSQRLQQPAAMPRSI